MKQIILLLSFSVLPLLGLGQQPAELQPVQWNLGANVQLTTYSGGITKNLGGSTTWNGGAYSTQRILRNGRVEFSAVPGSQAMIGLSGSSASDNYTEIDCAIYIQPSGTSTTTGTTTVRENGTAIAALALGNFTAYTTFRIERVGTEIHYSKIDPHPNYPGDPNHQIITTKISSVKSYGHLLVDTSFYKQGSELDPVLIATGDRDNDGMADDWEAAYLPANFGWTDLEGFTAGGDADNDGVINLQEFLDGTDPTNSVSLAVPILWTNRVNTTATSSEGGLQRGTAAAGWTADADSGSQQILGDGMVAFTVPLASHLSVGLTPSNDSRTYTDLEYRIHVTSANACSVRAPGQSADLAIGSYTQETRFAIRRISGVVQFIKDGIVVYTSTTPNSGALLVDCSLYNPSTQISTARIASGDVDGDLLPDAWELAYLSQEPGFSSLTALDAITAFTPTGTGSDPDQDGRSNQMEYFDGTNPFKPLGYSSAVTWKTGVVSPAVMTASGVDGQVKKTASSNVWNADAVAMKDATDPLKIVDAGTVAFSAAASSYLAVGLTSANTSRSSSDLEYYIVLTASNTANAYTSGGALVKALGSYDAASRFAIRRIGSKVEYLKDGEVFGVATIPLTVPMLVDSSFYSLNAEITSAHLYTGDIDQDGMPDSWEIAWLSRWLGYSPSFSDMSNGMTAGTTGAPGAGSPGDLDGDGLSNLDEYRSGTDPTQQTSRPISVTWNPSMSTTSYLTFGADGGIKKTSGGAYSAWSQALTTIHYPGTVTFQAMKVGTIDVGLCTESNISYILPDYRFILATTGVTVKTPELSTAVRVASTYDATTMFAIQYDGAFIRFLMDGVVVATSAAPVTVQNGGSWNGTLYFDFTTATLNSELTSARLFNADLSGYSNAGDGIPDAWQLDQLWHSLGQPAGFNVTLAELAQLTDSSDLDSDGLDMESEYEHGTLDYADDSDGDGMSDTWEVLNQLTANDPSDAGAATSGDGFTNLQKYQWSLLTWGSSNQQLTFTVGRNDDVDGDGLPDPWELFFFGDIRAQNAAGDPDHDGASNLVEFEARTDPTWNPEDSDHDGLPDPQEMLVFGNLNQTGSGDPDHDGLTNFTEILVTLTNPLVADTNGDGYMDGYLGSFAATDSDGDGLTNGQETAMGTDSNKADTDGDGVIDSLDAFPINSMLQTAFAANPGDTTPPVITVDEPLNATKL